MSPINAAHVTVAEGSNAVSMWLFGCAGMVGSMILLGGATRVTRSGLSMVDWRPQGGLPPMNEAEWEAEFRKYQAFPEFQQHTGAKTIAEFKPIYYLEWGHRMWGRLIGVAFAVPGLWFAARGQIPPHLRARLVGLFGLGGAQGLVGWWMVKSGLEAKQEHCHEFSTQEARVSPYRLAAHLGTAFVTYAGLLWTALDIARPTAASTASACSRMQKVRGLAAVSTGVLAATVLSGAFVAGNDAGLAYNTFPKMGDVWVPEEVLAMDPVYRNFFENTATVQLDHRLLALATTTAVLSLFGFARFGAGGATWAALPPRSRALILGALGLTGAQASLGVSTLLNYVPEHLAVAHQGGAIVLFTTCLSLVHSLRFARAGTAAAHIARAAKL
eukprot:g1768.t1